MPPLLELRPCIFEHVLFKFLQSLELFFFSQELKAFVPHLDLAIVDVDESEAIELVLAVDEVSKRALET